MSINKIDQTESKTMMTSLACDNSKHIGIPKIVYGYVVIFIHLVVFISIHISVYFSVFIVHGRLDGTMNRPMYPCDLKKIGTCVKTTINQASTGVKVRKTHVKKTKKYENTLCTCMEICDCETEKSIFQKTT